MIIERHISEDCARYSVCADALETGDKPAEIAQFKTLELAAVVMRYLRGDSLSDVEEYRAKEALKKVDAPTVQSKRVNEAE